MRDIGERAFVVGEERGKIELNDAAGVLETKQSTRRSQ
jgi:hypothetical protein